MRGRTYPVPRAISSSARVGVSHDALEDHARRCAQVGRVHESQLPILASSAWAVGSEWASTVLTREHTSRRRKATDVLTAAGYDPRTYSYHGVLDSAYPDHELIMAVARSSNGGNNLERWDGKDWGRVDQDIDGTEFVMLDEDVLADVLAAINDGSSGVMLRPFNPKAWVRDCPVLDYPIMAAAGPPRHTGVMVAYYPDELVQKALAQEGGEAPEEIHLTLVYLGDSEDEVIDYPALQRVVARWARRVGPMSGVVSGTGMFTAGPSPVTYASVDFPALPQAREMLVRMLKSEGLPVRGDHGYTPHMTIAYDARDVKVPNALLNFEGVTVKYADDVQTYYLGQPMVAAGGAGPDAVFAIVDEFDTGAVLDLVRVLPGPIAYRRSGGKWIKDTDVLTRLMSVDPPPVVKVDPTQLADVLSQVDSYDKENPKSVTAAALWTEDLHPRAGGKFSKKQGQGAQPKGARATAQAATNQAGAKRPVRRPAAPSTGRGLRGPGKAPSGSLAATPSLPNGVTGADVRARPWEMMNKGKFPVPDAFWGKQPDGFKAWVTKFFAEHLQKSKAASKSSSSNTDNKDDRTAAQQKADKSVQVDNKKSNDKKAAAGKKSSQPSWWKDVPPEYAAAMRSLLNEAAKAGQAGGSAGADAAAARLDAVSSAQARVKHLDKADSSFDLAFAKEGLDEAGRREGFDRDLDQLRKRLGKAGANPDAVLTLIKQRAMAEKRRRAQFAAQRKLRAEQERVRRMEARHRETDQQNRESLTAASMMPPKLRKFWTSGKGRAKIRWGTGGDFKRCERALSKYLPAHMIGGACANLHKLATGKWPGKGNKH